MDESPLRSLRKDVESKLDLPDFGSVARRGDQIRRRRAVAAGAVVALAVATTALTLSRAFDTPRSQEPVHQPLPRVDVAAARRVLADPAAQVDTDASRVDGTGAMLAVVVVGTRTSDDGSGPTCPPTGQRSAVRWTGPHGGTHAWLGRPRRVEPVTGGFVVAAVPAACPSSDPSDARAYVVGDDGVPRGVSWGRGAERICATRPDDVRCRFDARSGRASVDPEARLPRGAVALTTGADRLRWARSSDFRTVFWSTDGRTWRKRTTTAPVGEIVSASAAGRWAVLASGTSVEVTSDGGATWRRRDLTEAVRAIRVGDVDWTVTSSGVLLGATELVGRGDVLFRSTDASWKRFVETDVHTAFGLVRPVVVGDAVYVVDDERWAVSTDGGATWRRTPRLP